MTRTSSVENEVNSRLFLLADRKSHRVYSLSEINVNIYVVLGVFRKKKIAGKH